jgi:hypothetical protein
VETVYYQADGQQPVSVERGFSRTVGEGALIEQRLAVTEGPSTVDYACSQLVVTNTTGEGLKLNPTLERRAEISRAVVEVAGTALLAPGESLRFRPCGPVSLRCRCGTADVAVEAFPG